MYVGTIVRGGHFANGLLVAERNLPHKEQQRQRQGEEQNGVHLLNIIE